MYVYRNAIVYKPDIDLEQCNILTLNANGASIKFRTPDFCSDVRYVYHSTKAQ